MGDREARILGAGESIKIRDKDYMLRPVVAQHLCDCEREALRAYKRQVLSTYEDSREMFKGKEDLLFDRIREVSQWCLYDLPQKEVFDCRMLPVTPELKDKIAELYGADDLPDSDVGFQALTIDALESKRLSKKEVQKLTGSSPRIGKVRYDQWWVTNTAEGRIVFVLPSVRQDHPEVTAKDVANWPLTKLTEAAHIVEMITAADLGNT